MPEPQKLPRKYLAQLQQAREELRLLGLQARRANERIGASHCSTSVIQNLFREIESSAFRIALELSELKLVADCVGCPAAPPSIPAQVHLLLLAEELERQPCMARRCTLPPTEGTETQEDWPSEALHLFVTTSCERNAKKDRHHRRSD